MRKIITAFLIILCLTAANVYADDITVIMDGEEMSFDQPPVIMNDSTLVPFRALFERLGMEVEWNGDDKSVTAYNSETEIALSVGYNIMYVNDDEVELLASPVIINDRTLVPLRAISEAIGADVDWNGNTCTVTINTLSANKTETEEEIITEYLDGNNDSEWAHEILTLTNAERQKEGLNPLKWDNTLSLLALMHCEDMIRRNFFDHVNPDGEDPFDRMAKFSIGYWAAGENIAVGQQSPKEAITDWMNSAGHRENILNPKFKSLGVAVLHGGAYGTYLVQEFALLK